MRRFISPVAAGAVVSGVLATVAVTPAHAAVTDADLAAALDLPSGITVTQAGDPRGIGVFRRTVDGQGRVSGEVNDFPSRHGNDRYAVLSTGLASDLFNMSVPGMQPSTNLDGPDDKVSLTFEVGPGAVGSCLLMDVAMGTEERVQTYDPRTTPSDTISLRSDGDPTEYAQHMGSWYIGQDAEREFEKTKVKPVPMDVNSIDYWHGVNQEFERQPDDHSKPLIPDVTPFNHFSSVETFEVPIAAGSAVTLSIADANNQSLDSIALVDRVRIADQCSGAASAETGLMPLQPAVVVGHRGVQNVLTVDLKPDTPQIERYDAAGNGWHPGGVDLRFRWYRYWIQTSNCNDGLLAHWEPIRNADRQSYAPTIDEKGHCLMAVVTGKKDGYRTETFPSPASAQWTPTLQIQDGVFTNTSVPTVTAPSSTIQVNDVLTASTGSFSPRPDSYSYQWWADNQAISGETGEKLSVTAAQAGKVIKVRVTAQRLNFNDMTIESAPTVPVTKLNFTSTPDPRIIGSGVQGQQLTVVAPTWTPETTFSYQWYRDDVKITGQTRESFTPSAGMIGSDIHVVVASTRNGYNVVSRPSAKVRVTGAAFTGGVVTITGALRVGQRLTASATGWAPVSPATRRYTWLVGGRPVQEGTSAMFTVPPTAAGQRIQVQVRGERTGYAPTTIASAPSSPIARGVLTTNTPRIFGSARPKGTLRASASWRPAPVTYRYQWYVGSKKIPRATKSSYKVPAKYRNKKIRVRITGYKSGYTTVARYSAFKRIAKK